MATKLEEYDLFIREGYPPPRTKTQYDTKLPNGALPHIGNRIKPGQFVENVSVGSAGKLRGLIEVRGLMVISRQRQGEKRSTLYVVTPQWAAENPDS